MEQFTALLHQVTVAINVTCAARSHQLHIGLAIPHANLLLT